MNSLCIENENGQTIVHCFPSGDRPGKLYFSSKVNHFSKEEVIKLYNYLAVYLGTASISKNLNKQLIGEIDAKS